MEGNMWGIVNERKVASFSFDADPPDFYILLAVPASAL